MSEASGSPEIAPSHAAAWLNLSHELRTPVHAILGHVELLLSSMAGPLSPEARESVGEIQRAALDLKAQISNVVQAAERVACPTPTSLSQRTACDAETMSLT